MISLLISVVILGLIVYLVIWVTGYLGLPEPIKKVITVVVIILAVLYFLGYVLPWAGIHLPPSLR